MTTTKPSNLMEFCAAESTRYLLDVPYVRNGYCYASNGVVAIRVDAPGETDTPLDERLKLAPIDDILNQCTGTDWRPWPNDSAYVFRDSEPCPTCNGSGLIGTRTCGVCEGTGETECPECGHEKECHDCRGSGKTGGKICPECCGKKYGRYLHHKVVNTNHIARKYSRLIETLPNVEYCADATSDRPMVWFRFDGGSGVVMGLRK